MIGIEIAAIIILVLAGIALVFASIGIFLMLFRDYKIAKKQKEQLETKE